MENNNNPVINNWSKKSEKMKRKRKKKFKIKKDENMFFIRTNHYRSDFDASKLRKILGA